MRKQEHHEEERANRFEELRRLEERTAQLREFLDMDYVDPLAVSPSKIPHGWEYRWVRESVLGEPDNGRVVEMKKKGWTPVPSERHPDMVFDDFLGRMGYLKGYIFHKGLILCERPIEFGDKERKALAEKNHQIINSMPGTENFMGEPTMPAKFMANPTVTRGAEFSGNIG